jgi:hypothetical protein
MFANALTTFFRDDICASWRALARNAAARERRELEITKLRIAEDYEMAPNSSPVRRFFYRGNNAYMGKRSSDTADLLPPRDLYGVMARNYIIVSASVLVIVLLVVQVQRSYFENSAQQASLASGTARQARHDQTGNDTEVVLQSATAAP